jgi:cobalt-zinc-cadmium efflux system outer membrane protein
MSFQNTAAIFALVAFLTAPVAYGQRLTLAQALAQTLQSSPELASYSWNIRAAEARIIQAKLRPNPALSIESENITGSGDFKSTDEMMENTLQLSQLVELGGKRTARVQEAQSERQLADWEYQIKRIDVLRETTTRFIEALAAERKVELAQEIVSVAERVIPVTQRLLESGKASDVELTRANVAVASARIELEQSQRDLLTAKSNLAAQWGAIEPDFTTVGGELAQLRSLPSIGHLKVQLQRNPQLARWTTEREKRQATLVSARAQERPDVTLSAGPRLIGRGDDVTLVAGVSIPLPFWNRNQGAIAEAEANVSKTADEQRNAEARAYAQLNEAYQRLSRAGNEANILERDVIPGARTAVDTLLDGYDRGRFSQLEVLEARRTLNEARSQQLRVLADYHKAKAELDALTAQPIELSKPAAKASLLPATRKK